MVTTLCHLLKMFVGDVVFMISRHLNVLCRYRKYVISSMPSIMDVCDLLSSCKIGTEERVIEFL